VSLDPGFIVAYDARTGKEAWRFNTIWTGEPGHEPGGDSWQTGASCVDDGVL